jgi:hypothetical protein
LASTYLSTVNAVLTRLRESTVTTVAQTPYSLLIGALVNDAKREVEDSWQWSMLMDYINFTTTAGTYSYDLSSVNTQIRGTPAIDRARLWIDPTISKPWFINTTPNYEFNLAYEPTLSDYQIKTAIINQNDTEPPKYWQLFQSPTSATANQWNKQVRLFAIPNGTYNMSMYIVNPQVDLVNDTDVYLCPTAPVVLKAYLFALYERGEELGEMLTLTTDKLAQSLADAISYDQSNSSQVMHLTVPYGGQY